jgi:6-phosphogluconolactonase
VADLGSDAIYGFRADSLLHDDELELEIALHMRRGAGPRHLATHPTLPVMYILNELRYNLLS